jgi:hypothetical protein
VIMAWFSDKDQISDSCSSRVETIACVAILQLDLFRRTALSFEGCSS